MRTLVQRFWPKVSKTSTCWLWTAKNDNGYGRIRVGAKFINAHRVAYELLIGPIAEGLQLDHLCKNTFCVNPEHLEPVTPRENVLRSSGIAAVNARKTHCKNGHLFTPNSVYTSQGKRDCKICKYDKYHNNKELSYAGNF